MRSRTVALAIHCALAFTFAPGVAVADAVPSLDVRTWAPSVDPRANLVLEPPSSPGPWLVSMSAWLRYENDSVTLREPSGAVYARPVEDLSAVDLAMSLGLGARGLVGLRLPFVLEEHGSGSVATSYVSSGTVPTSSIGDLSLLGKGTLIDNDRGGLGLAALGEVTFPTGSGTSFMGESEPTVTARMLADLSVRVASVQASLGYTVRTSHVEWPTAASGGIVFGNSIPWTFGVVLRPALLRSIDPDGRHTWEAALHGSLPGGPVGPFGLGQPGSAAESPALLAVSDRIAIGHYHDGFVLLGVDVGLDHAIGVPSFRAVIGLGVRFADHDKDGDGIPDDEDQCPDLAEDRDGFEDADGCPDADNDDDGIIDAEDACPNVPGVRSPDRRKNGCPAEVIPPRETAEPIK